MYKFLKPDIREATCNELQLWKNSVAGNNSSNLIISQFAKRMGFSNIEKEMREIYEIKLSTSTIFIITNKVKHAA